MQFNAIYDDTLHKVSMEGSKPVSSLYLQLKKIVKGTKPFTIVYRQNEVQSSKQLLSEIFTSDGSNYIAVLEHPEKIETPINEKTGKEIVTALRRAKDAQPLIDQISIDQVPKVIKELRAKAKAEEEFVWRTAEDMFKNQQGQKKLHGLIDILVKKQKDDEAINGKREKFSRYDW